MRLAELDRGKASVDCLVGKLVQVVGTLVVVGQVCKRPAGLLVLLQVEQLIVLTLGVVIVQVVVVCAFLGRREGDVTDVLIGKGDEGV